MICCNLAALFASCAFLKQNPDASKDSGVVGLLESKDIEGKIGECLRYVAVCCGIMRYVVVCCGVLRCVAICCGVLRYVVVCRSMLRRVAVCCDMLRCVAICCGKLWCDAICCGMKRVKFMLIVLGV